MASGAEEEVPRCVHDALAAIHSHSLENPVVVFPRPRDHGEPKNSMEGYCILERCSAETRRELLALSRENPGISRAVGALVGMAVGDSLGAPLEYLDVRDHNDDPSDSGWVCATCTFSNTSDSTSCAVCMIPRPLENIGDSHNQFELKAGQWTDDTSMGLCLADSLLVKRRYDGSDARCRYYAWCYGAYNAAFRDDPGREYMLSANGPGETKHRNAVGCGQNMAKSIDDLVAGQVNTGRVGPAKHTVRLIIFPAITALTTFMMTYIGYIGTPLFEDYLVGKVQERLVEQGYNITLNTTKLFWHVDDATDLLVSSCINNPTPEPWEAWLPRWVMWHTALFFIVECKLEILPRQLRWLPIFWGLSLLVVIWSGIHQFEDFRYSKHYGEYRALAHIGFAYIAFFTCWFETVTLWCPSRALHVGYGVLVVSFPILYGAGFETLGHFQEWSILILHLVIVWYKYPTVQKQIESGTWRPWVGCCHCCCPSLEVAEEGTNCCPPSGGGHDDMDDKDDV